MSSLMQALHFWGPLLQRNHNTRGHAVNPKRPPDAGEQTRHTHSSSPHGPVEAVGAEAMSTLGLERPAQDIVAAVAQVLVLQLVAQDLLGEPGLIALHGRWRGRFLRGHAVCLFTRLTWK